MTDKQVGEIWQFYTTGIIPDSWNLDCLGRDWTEDLIIKIVAERAAIHPYLSKDPTGERAACVAFGIPYDDYLKAKEASDET